MLIMIIIIKDINYVIIMMIIMIILIMTIMWVKVQAENKEFNTQSLMIKLKIKEKVRPTEVIE